MPKTSRTHAHLRDARFEDGVDVVPPHLADAPTFIRRLGYRLFEPKLANSRDWQELIETIVSSGDAAWFCDNSVFSDDRPAELWGALLERPGRLVLTPGVQAELAPWLASRPTHPIGAGLHQDGLVAKSEAPGLIGRNVYDYYVHLLHVRRLPLLLWLANFLQTNERSPTRRDKAEAMDRIQAQLGPRGALLAKKGTASTTDEELVYLAVEHAVVSGRQSVILTADADVSEQFFKLMWLMNTHYRSMFIGDVYLKENLRLRPRPLLNELLPDEHWPFETAIAIDRSDDPFLRDVLPHEFNFVAVSCATIGKYFSTISYGAEEGMARLLRVKDRTGGLSTDRLGGRNVHAWLFPIPLTMRFWECAGITKDRRAHIFDGRPAIAFLDLMHSQFPVETHGRTVEMTPAPVLRELERSTSRPAKRRPN